MKQKIHPIFLLFLVLPLLIGMNLDKTSILDTKVNFKVHYAETLESVIFRLQEHTSKSIDYRTSMLVPYHAKVADYKQTPIREILSQQLAGTPIIYRIKRDQLILYLETASEK